MRFTDKVLLVCLTLLVQTNFSLSATSPSPKTTGPTSTSTSSPSSCNDGAEATPPWIPFIIGVFFGAVLACIPVCYASSMQDNVENNENNGEPNTPPEEYEERNLGEMNPAATLRTLKRVDSTAAHIIFKKASLSAQHKKEAIKSRKVGALARLHKRLHARNSTHPPRTQPSSTVTPVVVEGSKVEEEKIVHVVDVS